MPKVKWISQPKPKANELAALFHAYRVARRMTSAQIGEAVGTSAAYARYQMNKPGKEWNIGQLLLYCDVLGIPYDDALEAAAK